ncbi:MAG: glutamine synthetase, partial [Chloroflexota bacterium]
MDNPQETVLRMVRDAGVRFISLQFTDIVGMLKAVVIPTRQLEGVLARGMWFDGSSIEGFARISESDMFLVPDPTTLAIIPWEANEHASARLICNVHTPDGEP